MKPEQQKEKKKQQRKEKKENFRKLTMEEEIEIVRMTEEK